MTLPAGISGDAMFVDQGRRRLWLSRAWPLNQPQPYHSFWLWIGMNPSTADATNNDPTVAKEVAITIRCGGKGYVKCNVLDWIETDSRKLKDVRWSAISSMNLQTIEGHAAKAERIVCAWGNLPRCFDLHTKALVSWLRKHELWCLGVNKNGSPKHPLYLRGDSMVQRYFPPKD